MAIVFGTGSIRLKSFTPEELKVQDLAPANSSIELRSKYFHLFWVPFFPIQKIWTIRLAGKQYSLPENAARLLESRKNAKPTPFYAFTGIILLAGAIVIIGGWNFFQKQKSRNYIQTGIEKDTQAMEDRINNVDTSDFFLFTQRSVPDKSCLMKVIGIKDGRLQFRMKYIKLKAEYIDSAKLSYMISSFDYGGDTLLIDKNALKRSYKSSNAMDFGFQGEDLLQNGDKYKLWSVYKMKR